MASHLLWFRLPKGRVWHVAASGAQVALCGQAIPSRGERQPKRPPFGARPCPDCESVGAEALNALSAAGIKHMELPAEPPVPFRRDELTVFGDTVILDEAQGEFVSRAFLGTPLRMVVEPNYDGPPIVGDFGSTAIALPACEDCGHAFGNHDSLGVCQDVDENGDACECGEYLAVCHCGHPWALHDQDDGDCYFVFEEEPNGRQCACTEFRPVAS